jgi:PAS domain S-box-containing protein
MTEVEEGSTTPLSSPDVDALARAFSVLVAAHPDAAFLLDTDGRFLAVNSALCDRVQAQPEELLGRTFDSRVAAIDTAYVRERFERAVRGEVMQYEATGTRPDGTTFLTHITNVPVRTEPPTTLSLVVGFAIDVSNRAGELERVRASEDLLRLAGRMAGFGGWSVDATTRRVRLTDGALKILGFAPESNPSDDVAWALFTNAERARMSELLDDCLETGASFDSETAMTRADGSALRVRIIGEADRDHDGIVFRVHGAVWDITQYATERDRARDLEERLGTSLLSITDGLYFLDNDWRVTFVNPMTETLLGRSRNELIGVTLWDAYPETPGTSFEAAFHDASQTRHRVIHREWVALTQRWVDVTIYPVETGVVVHLRDATDEVRARDSERETRRTLEEQAALLDIARDAIVVRGLDGRVQYWNRAAAELYEIPAERALGSSITELIYDGADDFQFADEEVLREGYWAGELRQRSRSGRAIIADCRWQLVYDDQGAPRAVLCVNSDITAFRRDEEARTRSQRMESLGTLAGGVAHDLNNVLTPILMSAQLLAQNEHDPGRLELLNTLEASVKRGAEMVRQVLAFARGVDGKRETIDMDALFDDVLTYARAVLPASITIELDRSEPLPASMGDVTQLLQVLINLVVNARDAMPDGGQLTVSADRESFDDNVVSIGHVAAAGDFVVFSVEDNGHGMPADVAAKAFEPFFTTKAAGRGTGLGLSTTLAIVRSHGGFIQVYSEPERGTRVRVGFPVSTATPRSSLATPGDAALPRGSGELILVVDDEPAIVRTTCQMLEAHGYRTVGAANGRDAIDIVESAGHDVTLVLTDMMMPIMDGATASAYLEEHHPGIPIIMASGLTTHRDSTTRVGMGVSRFLAKPYTTRRLLMTVRDSLREHGVTEAVTE